jgi:hypothetical protein
MSRHEAVFSVFLTGPSDVTSDLDLVAEIIDEINLLIEGFGCRFHTFHWARNATPGLAPAAAQERINRQAEGYDIIVTIFGSRLGAPTIQYQSGTVEELSIALDRENTGPFGDDSVAIFFKQVSLNTVDSDLQSALDLQKFRKSLPGHIFYKEFSDDASLREAILRTFSRIIRRATEIAPGRAATPIVPDNTNIDVSEIELLEEEDGGLLDYVQEYEDGMNVATICMSQISETMNQITESINRATVSLQNADTRLSRTLQKHVIDDLSADMAGAADLISQNTDRLKDVFPKTLSALDRAVGIQSEDFGQGTGLSTSLDVANSSKALSITAQSAIHGTTKFMESISQSPRMTKNYNQSRRLLLKSLEKMNEFLESSARQAEDLYSRSEKRSLKAS